MGLNPDEADLLATGKRARLDLLPYKTYTTASDLFLWPVFLGLLSDIGVPLTLPTAHLLSGLAYASLAFAGWYIFFKQFGWKWATLVIAPTSIYVFSGVSATDYLSLGTELLPIMILLAAVLMLFAPNRNTTTRRLALAGVMAGASIWAKPQVGLLAVSILAGAVLVRALERSANGSPDVPTQLFGPPFRRDCLVALATFLAPTATFLLLILVSGTFHPFVKEAVAFLFTYVGTSNRSSSLATRLVSVINFIADQPFAFLWALGGLYAVARARANSARLRCVQLGAWALPVLSSFVTLFVLSQLFAHYGNILYAGAMFSAVVGVRIAAVSGVSVPAGPRHWYPVAAYVFGAIVVVSCWFIAFDVRSVIGPNLSFLRGYLTTVVTKQTLPPVDPFDPQASNLSSLCPPNSDVLVWGWSALLYSYYNWQPASRYDDSYWQIDSYGDPSYYRSVLLAELTHDPPRCILEAIGGYFFDQIPPTETVAHVIPGASSLLNSCYSRIVSTVGTTSPVAVYVRRPTCS